MNEPPAPKRNARAVWIILIALVAPAVLFLVLGAWEGPITTFYLPVLSGLVCGITLFIEVLAPRNRESDEEEPMATEVAKAIAFGIVCAITSFALMWGTCWITILT